MSETAIVKSCGHDLASNLGKEISQSKHLHWILSTFLGHRIKRQACLLTGAADVSINVCTYVGKVRHRGLLKAGNIPSVCLLNRRTGRNQNHIRFISRRPDPDLTISELLFMFHFRSVPLWCKDAAVCLCASPEVVTHSATASVGEDFIYSTNYPSNATSKKFFCRGEDPSTCQTQRNNRVVIDDDTRNVTITIRMVTTADAGTYWCGAQTTNGQSSHLIFYRLFLDVGKSSN